MSINNLVNVFTLLKWEFCISDIGDPKFSLWSIVLAIGQLTDFLVKAKVLENYIYH